MNRMSAKVCVTLRPLRLANSQPVKCKVRQELRAQGTNRKTCQGSIFQLAASLSTQETSKTWPQNVTYEFILPEKTQREKTEMEN